ncbi:MAG: glycosyltransferase [Acidimicrobiales bacterium]
MLDGQTVALCMIVRDESAVLERCVGSVADLVDHWVICDTGSVDGTPALVDRLLGHQPGRLLHHEWVDFGHNRTLLMEAASGAADWLLLLDADMTLQVTHPVGPLDPAVDAWLLRHDGDLDYAVPRLVRGDRDWRFQGATHEHLAADGPTVQRELSGVVVHHHADGGSRADKFERDLGLLERAVAERSDDARSWFYLAQTLRDLGRREEAITAYRRRVELGGWAEEVAYAHLQVGLLTADADPAGASAALHRAWEVRPSRAEALHALARLHRDQRQPHSARLFADAGLALPPSTDLLFVHRDVERWGLRFERSIAAYWTGDVETALLDTDAVLSEPDLPGDVADHARRNRQHCLDRLADHTRPLGPSLPRLSDLAPATRLGRVDVAVDPPWPLCNPTLAADPDGGYRTVVRLVSYVLDDEGRYGSVDGHSTIRTANVSIHLDDDLRPTHTALLDDPTTRAPAQAAAVVLGHEDLRLVRHRDRWWGLATVRDRTPDHRCQVALVEVTDDGLRRSRPLEGPDPDRHQKNWMPFVRDGRLRAIHTCGGPDTVVVEIDSETATVEVVARHRAHPLLGPWRGGSPLIDDPETGGHLAVVHDVVWVEGRRTYRHRLVAFSSEARPVAATPWWSFEGDDIEFAAGLARWGDQLVISYGIHDRAAGLATMPAADLRSLLEPLPPPG